MAVAETFIILVSAEQVAGVDLVLHIIQAAIIAVGNDSLTTFLKLLKVIHNFAAEEGRAILQSRLIDNDRCSFGLNALHNALNRGLAEVVRVGFHGQAVHANHNVMFLAGIIRLI